MFGVFEIAGAAHRTPTRVNSFHNFAVNDSTAFSLSARCEGDFRVRSDGLPAEVVEAGVHQVASDSKRQLPASLSRKVNEK